MMTLQALNWTGKLCRSKLVTLYGMVAVGMRENSPFPLDSMNPRKDHESENKKQPKELTLCENL